MMTGPWWIKSALVWCLYGIVGAENGKQCLSFLYSLVTERKILLDNTRHSRERERERDVRNQKDAWKQMLQHFSSELNVNGYPSREASPFSVRVSSLKERLCSYRANSSL